MWQGKTVSVILPTYNEKESILASIGFDLSRDNSLPGIYLDQSCYNGKGLYPRYPYRVAEGTVGFCLADMAVDSSNVTSRHSRFLDSTVYAHGIRSSGFDGDAGMAG